MANPFHRLLTGHLVLPLLLGRGGVRLRGFRAELDRVSALDPEARRAWQLERLRTLATLATDASAHYGAAFAAAGVAAGDLRTFADIARLPVLEKADLAAGVGPFLTGDPGGGVAARTTGSTGQPVTVIHGRSTHARQLARRVCVFARLGLDFAGAEARLWGRPLAAGRERLTGLAANRRVFTFSGGDEDSLAREIDALRRYRPDYIYGYASIILRAASLLAERGLDVPGLRAVVSTAESLPESGRRRAAEIFGCPVVQEYGCSEVDIIAFPCAAGSWHVLEDRILLEVEPGTGEALVTDLDNRLMPLIRYRLGDRLSLAEGRCGCGWTTRRLAAVAGRSVERYVELPDGSRVHAVVFGRAFERLADAGLAVTQFRAVQTAVDRVHLTVAGGPAGREDELAAGIRAELAPELGPALELELEFGPVRLEAGGKNGYFESKI